jgi:hypothetical protein
MVMKSRNWSSETAARADRATLQCGGGCGVIVNLATKERLDATYTEGILWNEGIGDVTIPPGTYVVNILVRGKLSPWDRVIFDDATFTAAPGGTYQVKRDTDVAWFGDDNRYYAWIEDAKTGEVVGGTKMP